MKKFIFKTLLFVATLVLLDRCFILFREAEHNIFADIAIQKMKKVSSKLRAKGGDDILFVGSSHGQFAISPQIVSDSLHKSSFNLAYGGGSNMGLQMTLLKKLVTETSYKPKTIVFAIDVFTLNATPFFDDPVQNVFFQNGDDILKKGRRYLYSCFKLYGKNLPEYISGAVKGNFKLPYFKKSFYDLSMFDKYEKYEISEDGWVKGFGILNKKYLRYADMTFNPDPKSALLLNEYVQLCRDNGIELFFIQVPEHAVSLEFQKKYIDFGMWMKKLTQKSTTAFIDFDTEQKFPVNNDSLFFDSDHLNKTGAEKFSKLLAADLKKIVK